MYRIHFWRELNLGHPAKEFPRPNPHLSRMRQRMRSPEGRRVYAQRKGMVEPVFGILKEQRGMRSFRMRGITKVESEFALAAISPPCTATAKSPPKAGPIRDAQTTARK